MNQQQPNFSRRLLADRHREELVNDCVALVLHRIELQKPLRRILFKAGITLLDAIRDGALRYIVVDMLPRFALALEPLHEAFEASPQAKFSDFLLEHRQATADQLLAVTDDRVHSYGHAAVTALYAGLRPSAAQELALALPELGHILDRYLFQSGADEELHPGHSG